MMATLSPIAELAARNRAAKLAQLQRLRPTYHNAKAAVETLRQAKAGASDARASLELMRQLKYIPGFFPTPPAIVAEMTARAGIEAGQVVLEPSAGKGDIAKAIQKAGARVQCVEKVFTLAEHLRKLGFNCVCSDFMTWTGGEFFDAVLMNPPFENRQDVAHIQRAFEFLKPGGRLVAIASSTSGARLDSWAGDHGGYIEPMELGAFKTSERPTGVNCAWVIAEK
jgi:protein-L-isoaspartate O-methyltransferase